MKLKFIIVLKLEANLPKLFIWCGNKFSFSLSICDQNLFLTHAAAFFRQHFQPLYPQRNEKLSAKTKLLTGHYQQVKKLGKIK